MEPQRQLFQNDPYLEFPLPRCTTGTKKDQRCRCRQVSTPRGRDLHILSSWRHQPSCLCARPVDPSVVRHSSRRRLNGNHGYQPRPHIPALLTDRLPRKTLRSSTLRINSHSVGMNLLQSEPNGKVPPIRRVLFELTVDALLAVVLASAPHRQPCDHQSTGERMRRTQL
jgi:hypothetical protein